MSRTDHTIECRFASLRFEVTYSVGAVWNRDEIDASYIDLGKVCLDDSAHDISWALSEEVADGLRSQCARVEREKPGRPWPAKEDATPVMPVIAEGAN